MGGAEYSISAAGSATELHTLFQPNLSWELIAGSNLAQEDHQRVRDHVLLLGSIYHLCKSTACPLSATYILPNTVAPPLCCSSEPLGLCSRLPRALEAERPSRAGRGESCSAALWLIYEETFCGRGRWRPIRPRAQVSPGVFVFSGVERRTVVLLHGPNEKQLCSKYTGHAVGLESEALQTRQCAFAPIYLSCHSIGKYLTGHLLYEPRNFKALNLLDALKHQLN